MELYILTKDGKIHTGAKMCGDPPIFITFEGYFGPKEVAKVADSKEELLQFKKEHNLWNTLEQKMEL